MPLMSPLLSAERATYVMVYAGDGGVGMRNAIIMLGALVGIVLGGWIANFLFHPPGAPAYGVTLFLGAIPGMFAGAWAGLRFSKTLA